MSRVGTGIGLGYARWMGTLGYRLPATCRARCAIAALILASAAAWAETAVFERLSVVDGLPDSSIEAIVQDRHGYVWIGTQGGLVRHEGAELNVLRHDPEDPASLPGNNVLSLLAGDDGSVWAAISGAGIVRLQGTEVVRHWAPSSRGGVLQGNYVWSMAEACDGTLWGVYATDGVLRIEPQGAAAWHFEPGRAGLPDDGFAVTLRRDDQCRLWMLRTDGLYRVIEDGENSSFVRVLESEPDRVPIFLDFDLDRAGRAWLGGTRGVVRAELPGPGDRPATARAVIDGYWKVGGAASVVRPTVEDRVWLGTDRGVRLLQPQSGAMTEIGDAFADPDSAEFQILDILPGTDGGIWLATQFGVLRLDPGWRGFRIHAPRDAIRRSLVTATVSHGNATWVGVEGQGVLQFEPATGRFTPVDPPLNTPDQRVLGLHVDDRRLWVLTRTQLVRRDRESGRDQVLISVPQATGDRLALIEPVGDGGMWVGFDGGRLERLGADGRSLAQWHADADGVFALDVPEVQRIARGPDGHWWLLGLERVFRLDQSGRFVPMYRSPTQLRSLAWLGDTLWLGADSLLEKLRLADGVLVSEARLTAGDGLPPGRIQALVPRDDELWLTLSIGLARLDTSSSSFRLLTVGGARGLEFQPGAVSPLPNADGAFAAGSDHGLVIVQPDRVMPEPVPPPVYITSMRVGDAHYDLGPARSVDLPEFDWRLNSPEFAFRALAYVDPERNRYRARLVGWDSDWVELGTQSRHRYANLPAGSYRFEVQAAGVEGVWNRTGDAVEFTVRPPPWRSPAALAGYAVVLIALALAGWRAFTARRANLAAMREARARRELAERASQAKSEFLATMSHEIRTPLHGMMGMMELLERGEPDPGRIEMFGTMRGSGRQLQRILNDILDLSRIEAGHADLDARPFELTTMLEQAVALHASNAQARGLDLRLRIAHDLPVAIVGDRDRLAQVIGNLLSNAIKFTHRGAVELQAELRGPGRLVLAVVDSGPGIAPEVQRELFEPFAQLETGATRRHSGTGLGLTISRRLIESMGGTIAVSSVPGHGSRFELRLPVPDARPRTPQPSALLDGLVLDARLSAPDRRVLARLVRRWALPLLRFGETPPAGSRLVRVVDRRASNAKSVAGPAALELVLLRSGAEPGAENTQALRTPLTETRLLGALFDFVLAPDAGDQRR